jgi:TatD DNase family protein
MGRDLIDIGVNLTNQSFHADLGDVMQRARDAGVSRQVVTGSSVAESRAAADLAAEHSGVLFCTAGVHPHNAKQCDDQTLSALRDLAALEQTVAVGECGLDFNRDFSPRPVQLAWFERQVELACELQLPLFIHERDAAAAMTEIIERHRSRITAAVVHCFTGDGAALDAYLALDLHIGITGWICDERRGLHLRDLVGRIPADRLMIETDAPYLTPRTMREKPRRGRNEPAFLPHVLDVVAECTGRSRDQVAAETTSTAERFFGLVLSS